MKKLKWDLAKLEECVKTSNSIYEVARKLGLKPWRGNCETINRWIEKKQISKTHFDKQLRYKQILGWNKRPLEELQRLTPSAKKHIKQVLGNICGRCKLGTQWFNEELVLHVDHINGNPSDNRIENLRILCPNCHSQTKTYCGRNVKRK